MPTYTVTHSNFKLQTKTKVQIAKGITRVHNLVTGANTYFAQVIFNKTKNNDHYMGGKKVREPQLFLHGQIRSGRSGKIKKKLILDLKNTLIKNSKLNETQIWVYIIDLTPSQMIEYGAILPESGGEAKWFKGLSPMLRRKLKKMESN
jgi:phenylpyruvate tautomerase PptA (4-oxalocrotonate tautomerase family)